MHARGGRAPLPPQPATARSSPSPGILLALATFPAGFISERYPAACSTLCFTYKGLRSLIKEPGALKQHWHFFAAFLGTHQGLQAVSLLLHFPTALWSEPLNSDWVHILRFLSLFIPISGLLRHVFPLKTSPSLMLTSPKTQLCLK